MSVSSFLRKSILSAFAVALPFLVSCDRGVGPGGATRTYALGFTDFPHANTTNAILDAWDIIARDADMAVLHFGDGVPWQEALDGTAYPAGYQEMLDFRAAQVPTGHVVYLAVSPINSSRNGLAGYPGATPAEPLPPPWDTYGFDSPQVIAAFIAHCDNMISLYQPDYFAYAIEANILRMTAPTEWGDFVFLAEEVYTELTSRHPSLPIFVTLQADTYHGAPGTQESAISEILPYTDMIAVSGYPFMEPLSDPTALRGDYFSALADLAPGKPFAVAETAWPAEDVGAPYPDDIPASETTQDAYLARLLWDCDGLNAVFVNWFFTEDYDEFWASDMQYMPDAWLLRAWRDCGLYDGQGYPRIARTTWLDALARPRQ
jgi:hypothetical protein